MNQMDKRNLHQMGHMDCNQTAQAAAIRALGNRKMKIKMVWKAKSNLKSQMKMTKIQKSKLKRNKSTP